MVRSKGTFLEDVNNRHGICGCYHRAKQRCIVPLPPLVAWHLRVKSAPGVAFCLNPSNQAEAYSAAKADTMQPQAIPVVSARTCTEAQV